MRNRGSFSGFNLNKALIDSYSQEIFYSSIIPVSTGFPGFKQENGVQPRIKIIVNNMGCTPGILRQESERVLRIKCDLAKSVSKITNLPNEASPTIDAKHLLDISKKGQKTNILIISENSLDNKKLTEHITYNYYGWTQDKKLSWGKFEHVIRADLRALITKPHLTNLAQFLYDALNSRGIEILEQEVGTILRNQADKTLIILEWHLKPEQLRDAENYPNLQAILTSLTGHNIIITAKHYARKYVELTFKPNTILENTGYISRDIEKYLENNFQDHLFYQSLLSLFNSNKDLREICKSPSILEMVCYILLQGDTLKLQSSIKSPTMSGLYSDMMHLNGLRYGEKYITGYKGDVLSYPIVQFMQQLAYKALILNSKLISEALLLEVLEPYTSGIIKGLAAGTDPIELIKEFGVIQLDPNSSPMLPRYFFADFSFQEFMAASHLKNLLTSSEQKDISSAKLFIAIHGNNKEYLQTMKFLFGLISMHQEERSKLVAMETLGNALVYSSENVLKIGGNNQIIYMMHLLSQSIRNGELDPFIPQKVIDYLDNTILRNLEKWGPHLIKSQYLSTTIITELSNMLEGNKQEFLQASQILSLLNGINLEKKDEIAQVLMSKLLDNDLEIVETSVRSLQHMLDCEAVQSFLVRILKDPRVSVRLVAIEVQGQIANQNSVTPLLERLGDQDNWVVVATLDALKNLYHLRSLRENIISELMERLGKEHSDNQIILPKLLECLKHFQYGDLQIHWELLQVINKSTDIERANKAITAMERVTLIQGLDVNAIIDEMLVKYYAVKGLISSIVSNSKYYPIRSNIIDFLNGMFPKADLVHRDKIYALLEHDISSKSERVQIAIIHTLVKILPICADKQDGIFALLTKAMSSQFVHAKILAISIMTTFDRGYLLSKDPKIIATMTNILLTNIVSLTDKEILITAIQTLGNLSNRSSVENIVGIIRAIHISNQDEDIQNAIMEVIGEIFSQLSTIYMVALLSFIANEAETNGSEKVRITAIHAMHKNNEAVSSTQSSVVEEYITQLTLDSRSDLVKDVAIAVFLELYDDDSRVKKILSFYLNAAKNEESKAAAIYSVGRIVAKTTQIIDEQTLNKVIEMLFTNIDSVLQVIPSLMVMIGKIPVIKMVEISDKLLATTGHSNPIIRSLAINTLIHIATAPAEIKRQIKPLFGQDTRDKLLLAENIRDANHLANKYSNSDLIISPPDQVILNNLFYPILLRCLQTSNIFIHMRFINLLSKVRYDETAVLDVLDYELGLHINIQDKLRLIDIIRTIFSSDLKLLRKLEQISKRLSPEPIDLDSKFPNIDAIMANLDEFAQTVIDNHLDIRITIDKLILPEREYSFGYLANLELQLDYAKKLYLAIIALNQGSPLENEVEPLFYEITHAYLNYENIQLSVLHKTTDKQSLTDIILVAESKTTFGDILVKKISIDNHQLKIVVHRSIEENYPQLALGKPSDFEYHISSFPITPDEEIALLKSLVGCQNKEDLFSVLTNVFAHHLSHYNWRTDGIAIGHNKLIKFSGYEDRLARVEHRLKDIEQQLIETIKGFEGFKTSQRTINNIITSLQEKEQIEASPDLDDYQRGLLLKLAHELNELHMAAMVVQTEMVSNNQKGVVGNIGAFFNAVSAHVPIVGAAIDVLGSMLSAVDNNMQAVIAKNIANLSISSSDMAHIAKKLALKIATSKLKTEEFNNDDILAKIGDILNFATDVKASIITSIASLLSSRLEHQAELTSEEARGEQDAELILQILVSYIATGRCKLTVNWRTNYDILDGFFSKNYIITAAVPITTPGASLVIDTALHDDEQSLVMVFSAPTQSSKTPSRLKQSYKKAEDIANNVLHKARLLLGLKANIIIDQEQQEAFVSSLTSALAREDYADNQRLLYWSDQNRLLKDNLVGQLAQQLIQLKAFKLSETTLNVDPQFMIDDPVFTDIMDHARAVLQRHRYFDRAEKQIAIEYTAKTADFTYVEPSVEPPKLTDSNIKINIDLALTGGILMKSMEVLPALKYLLTDYIPIIPYIKDLPIVKAISQYEYPTSVFIYSVGSFTFAHACSIHPGYSLISAALFAAREPIYQFRAEKLNQVNKMEDGWIKFGIYIGTDTCISLAIAAPLVPITPLIAVGGLAIGSINYYNSQPHEDNVIANLIARTVTTTAIIPCKKFVEIYPTAKEQVLATGVCIGALANIHYFSKFAGNIVNELVGHHLLTGNSTEGEVN